MYIRRWKWYYYSYNGIQTNMAYYGYEYKQLFELKSNVWNFGCRKILSYTFSFSINYLKIALMTFFCCISLLSNNINHQVLNCILHNIILSSPYERIHKLISGWILNIPHMKRMTLFFLYYWCLNLCLAFRIVCSNK